MESSIKLNVLHAKTVNLASRYLLNAEHITRESVLIATCVKMESGHLENAVNTIKPNVHHAYLVFKASNSSRDVGNIHKFSVRIVVLVHLVNGHLVYVVKMTSKQNVHGAIRVLQASIFHFHVDLSTKLNAPRVSTAEKENRCPINVRLISLPVAKQPAPNVELAVYLGANTFRKHAMNKPILDARCVLHVETISTYLKLADNTPPESALSAHHAPLESGNLVHAGTIPISITKLSAPIATHVQ